MLKVNADMCVLGWAALGLEEDYLGGYCGCFPRPLCILRVPRVGKRYVAVAVFEGVVVVPVHPRARGKTQPCLLPTPSHGSYVGGLELGV